MIYSIYEHEDYESLHYSKVFNNLKDAIDYALSIFIGFRLTIHLHDKRNSGFLAGKVVARILEDKKIEINA